MRSFILLFGLGLARASEELYFQVDNFARVYFNGDLLYQDIDEGIDYGTIVLQKAPSVGDVIAIKGEVGGSSWQERGGILARVGEIATSPSWKCVSLNTFDGSSLAAACPGGPFSTDCNDAAWPSAIAQVDADYAYRGAALTPFWRGRGGGDDDAVVDTFTTRADWIWTSQPANDNPVVCRYTVRSSDTPGGEPDRCRYKRGAQHSASRAACKLDGTLQADTRVNFYYNNMLMASDGDSSSANSVAFAVELANRPQPGDVYGLHAVNDNAASHSSSLGGVVANIGDSHDTVTNAYWKCSSTWEEGWSAPGFNDSHWQPAVAQPDDCCDRPTAWDLGAARWIWTRSAHEDDEAYCRYEIPEVGTAWHVSTYRAHVGPGEDAAAATSYYCGPRNSYGELDGGDYDAKRADMLQTPPVTLPPAGSGDARLDFRSRWDIEPPCGTSGMAYDTPAFCKTNIGCFPSAWDAAAVFVLDASLVNPRWARLDIDGDGGDGATDGHYPYHNSYGAIVNGLAENGTCSERWWGGASASDSNPSGWRRLGASLAPYAGRTVRFGFLMVSDEYVQKDGMWLDDVSITHAGAVLFEDSADTMKCEGALIDSYDVGGFYDEDDKGAHHRPTRPPTGPPPASVVVKEGGGDGADAGLLTGMVFLGMAIAVVCAAGAVVCHRTGAAEGTVAAIKSGVASLGSGGGGSNSAWQRAAARSGPSTQLASLTDDATTSSSGAGDYTPVAIEGADI